MKDPDGHLLTHQPKQHPNSPATSSTPCTANICVKCGGPTSYPPPPQDSLSATSPTPMYPPIRSPAVNFPPNNSSQAIILAPVPKSRKVPTISPPYNFQSPSKRICSPDDILCFHQSDSGKNFLGFVVVLSEAIRSHKISDPCLESPVVKSIVSIIETLAQWVDEIPTVEQAARYGNVSYRTWHERLVEKSESLILRFLPDDLKASTVEIVPYFIDSFGNSSRIDYGTAYGMGVIREEDYHAVVARVFVKYLDLMRKLQLVYCLEPAGSHGVWGLDDYHFLPFIFGSSQLIDHKYMKPKSIHNEDILDNFSNEYMYLSCIAYIKKVKKGFFAEHSPFHTWNKVNSGMLKMYKAEVMEKVPIMQHFLFGWLIKCTDCLSKKPRELIDGH
ncbi:hypothetical protein K2173_007893 [Erythroxylum novogranatense]|uniref:Serine/threonine-protein phosphatase 2A activator n=1 Tax=Erythroxylum novogranatense TaxID=1862640 RepID=A0AAV8T7Z5_9ROSI|nr:hypothetical protein K2173_007893 [Erythroxylum novogranatense]